MVLRTVAPSADSKAGHVQIDHVCADVNCWTLMMVHPLGCLERSERDLLHRAVSGKSMPQEHISAQSGGKMKCK
jgi:hypothetical protein